jgi:small GTP-binding protein
MMHKKICMLGGFAVGKTSLVRRFVTNLFSEQYHTTIGVTVEKKILSVAGEDVTLMLWDLYGDDEFQRIRESYLRGSSGYILVVDGTRKETLATALGLQRTVEGLLGPIPFALIVNKSDVRDVWEIDDAMLSELRQQGWTIFFGSAKTGEGVESLFSTLADRLLKQAT